MLTPWPFPPVEGQVQGVLADDADGGEQDAERGATVVGVRQQEELVDHVVAALDPDLARNLRQHPHPLPLPEGTGRVVTKAIALPHLVEEGEAVLVLDRDVARADHPEYLLGVRADHRPPAGHRIAVRGRQRGERDVVVEARRGDSLGCGGRVVEPGPEAVPRGFADVHHRRLAVHGRQVV